jgi:Flp pilus assembly protein TadD
VDKAIEAFETVTRLMPEDCKAYYYLGIAYDKKGLPSKARDAYATADRLLK